MSSASRSFNTMAERLAQTLGLAREREDRLMAILAASDRGILVVDRDGRVSLASPMTHRLFPAFQPEAGLASISLPGLPRLVEEAVEKGLPVSGVLEEGERGRGRTFSVKVAPLEREGVVLFLREVTDEARLGRVKADLVANVSHELRTPLSALGALSETLSDPALPDEKRGHFQQRLQHQVRRMQALVDDLLSLSRLESAEVQPSLEDLPVRGVLEDLCHSLQPQAQVAGVSLRLECPHDLVLPMDRVLLETALKNLCENGIRYNKSGGEVTLIAEASDGTARFTVRDTGEGIPSSHLPRIFERFYRVDPARSREKGGTGLGLAIVKHAVSKLGGEVEARSTVGVGSTFIITLPTRPK